MQTLHNRGDMICFKEAGQEKYGVNVQNAAGNRFAPTIIVAEIELVAEKKSFHYLLESYPNEGQAMVVNLEKIRTIDKTRVCEVVGKFPFNKLKEIDFLLENTFNFDGEKNGRVIFVNLGKDVVGSEQGGERPAIVLKDFTDPKTKKKTYLVAVMTSKQSKRPIPTHVSYEVGEGGVVRASVGLFEQLKCVQEEAILNYYEFTPPKKLPNVKKAFNISLGIEDTRSRA